MVATVGQIDAYPGAGNVIAGRVRTSLDVRHASDRIRTDAVSEFRESSAAIAARRGLSVRWETRLEQSAVPMHEMLVRTLQEAIPEAPLMVSGAGHDAMVLAEKVPTAMLFLRSPGGISHHPDETVLPEDVAASLDAGSRLLDILDAQRAGRSI
jgi:allantoate deiminase